MLLVTVISNYWKHSDLELKTLHHIFKMFSLSHPTTILWGELEQCYSFHMISEETELTS